MLERFRALIDSMKDATPTADGPYNFRHQYEDWHAVLGTAAGARVFSQLDALLTPPPVPLSQIHDTALLIGNNRLALVRAQILMILGGEFLRQTGQAINNDDYDPRDNL